mmetsp:Transcript_3041/g.4094  ORF Transcript_3041/g.4094 Transcript_3041/m.4094 type:complete len:320 (-) Transcript_3041:102-1061(-)
MQSPRTLKFWDDYHTQTVGNQEVDQAQEWILRPTPALLGELLERCIPKDYEQKKSDTMISVLEIGCGTSTMARDMLVFWEEHMKELHKGIYLHVLATDVSSVCIDYSKNRDQKLLQNQGRSSSLEYSTLNAVEPAAEERAILERRGPFDLIFDKGGLDTFLFRSRHRGRDDSDQTVVGTVLHNICSWLKSSTGIYTTMTTRSKIKLLRDYRGFREIQRMKLTQKLAASGELESKSSKNKPENMKQIEYYAHICVKIDLDNSHDVGLKGTRVSEQTPDTDVCPQCLIAFISFRGGQSLKEQGAHAWDRKWNGHKTHCKGN